MAKKFSPLKLELIDEGRFMGQAEEDLSDLQAQLAHYCEEHGEKAKGAKAKLTIEVSLVSENPEQDLFSIKAVVKKQLPGRPPSVTAAIGSDDQEGQHCLFVRNSGSTEDSPRQDVLFTKDGKTVPTED